MKFWRSFSDPQITQITQITQKQMEQLSVLFLMLLDIAEIDININTCIMLQDGLFAKVRIY